VLEFMMKNTEPARSLSQTNISHKRKMLVGRNDLVV